MALDPQTIEQLAARLDKAERDRVQIGHFSLEHPEMTLEDGYAVSRAWVRHKLAVDAR
jgi:2-oxo-hept-3-ene-1,7-dioate hydratase